MNRTNLPHSTTRSTPTRRGSAIGFVLGGLALALCGAAMVASHVAGTTAEHTSTRVRLTAGVAKGWIVRAGLDPRALGAAGFSASDVAVIVGNAVDYLAESSLVLHNLENDLANARKELPRLESAATAGRPTAQDASALAQAQANLATLEGQANDQVNSVYTTATTGLDPVKLARLGAIKANRASGLPLEFAIQSRTDADSVRLRDALAAQSIAQRQGGETPEGAAQIISAATTADTSAAAERLANNAALVTAWNTAVAQAEGR